MISYYLPSGSKIGVGFQVHELANRMVALGHSVTVFSGCGPSEGALYETVQILLRGSNRTFKFALALRRVNFSGFEVLHAHGDDYWLWRRRVKAHVRTIHGSCFEEALRITGVRERLRMALLGCTEVLASLVADTTAVVSPQTRRWTPWVRTVIPNGVDLQRFAPAGYTAEDRVTAILFVGTYRQRKRGALLWKVFQEDVLPAVPDAQLWMVCSDAPEASSVHVLGKLTDAELIDRYRRAAVFCLPSSYEGFGIPYVEAMASELPVVATPNPGSVYVTDGGRAGCLVEDGELGATLVRLLNDSVERSRLASAGLRRSESFELDTVVNAYLVIYHELIDHQSA